MSPRRGFIRHHLTLRITLDKFKQLFYPELLKNLEWLVINGNFGDSVMNKQFREIISYVKEHDTRILIHTNGGIHGHDYWTDVGNILTNPQNPKTPFIRKLYFAKSIVLFLEIY